MTTKRTVGTSILILFFSLVTAYPAGLIYRSIFNLPGTEFGNIDVIFQGFFVSIPLWLSLVSIMLFSEVRSYLLFTLPTSLVYLILVNLNGSLDSFIKWILPVFLVIFVTGSIAGYSAKSIYKKFKE